MEVRNAIIESAWLGDDDHGGLSAFVTLNYGGLCQGFGGYRLYWPYGFETEQPQVNACGHYVWRCMQIADVDRWEKLKGKTVRVRIEDDMARAIGHIVKDDWFDPRVEFEKLRKINEGVSAHE